MYDRPSLSSASIFIAIYTISFTVFSYYRSSMLVNVFLLVMRNPFLGVASRCLGRKHLGTEYLGYKNSMLIDHSIIKWRSFDFLGGAGSFCIFRGLSLSHRLSLLRAGLDCIFGWLVHRMTIQNGLGTTSHHWQLVQLKDSVATGLTLGSGVRFIKRGPIQGTPLRRRGLDITFPKLIHGKFCNVERTGGS
jgi:hypothetical protein